MNNTHSLPDPDYDRVVELRKMKEMVAEMLRAISSRMDEKKDGPGIAIHAHVQDYQHIASIAKKWGINP
jgi:hypothetical protein